jgi:3-hydroxybutyryl-CoA dehydrogenase
VAAISRVGVVGCGLMGSGIAEVTAVAGLDVIVCEANADFAAAGRGRIESSLQRKVKSQKMTEAEVADVMARIRLSTDLHELADRDLVIEAVIEDEAEKLRVFGTLDEVVTSADAILASNTSSFPITRLAAATKRPDHVIGMHFFNPVPVLPLVEIIPSLLTSPDTVARVKAFATEVLHKTTIEAKDRAGFIVNFLLLPYLLSAIRMLENGVASAADIDAGMVHGCGHPMGPLTLTDLIGLDTTLAIANSLYAEYKDAAHVAPPLLMRMVESGDLGRKSGKGFFDYSK